MILCRSAPHRAALYVPRRLRTLTRHSHHLAAGCASNRGQPPPARGVGEFGCPKNALYEGNFVRAMLVVAAALAWRERTPHGSTFNLERRVAHAAVPRGGGRSYRNDDHRL